MVLNSVIDFVTTLINSSVDKISLVLVMGCMFLIWTIIKDKKESSDLLVKLDSSIQGLSNTVRRSRISEQSSRDWERDKIKEVEKSIEGLSQEIKELKVMMLSNNNINRRKKDVNDQ